MQAARVWYNNASIARASNGACLCIAQFAWSYLDAEELYRESGGLVRPGVARNASQVSVNLEHAPDLRLCRLTKTYIQQSSAPQGGATCIRRHSSGEQKLRAGGRRQQQQIQRRYVHIVGVTKPIAKKKLRKNKGYDRKRVKSLSKTEK